MIGKNREAVAILINMVILRFYQISLSLNYNKSVSISIENDHLDERPLSIIRVTIFDLYERVKKICYLGIDFSDNILIRRDKIPQHLKHNLDLLIGSPQLKAERKFPVINQCKLPKLVYCFQNISASKMFHTSLTNVDNLIKKLREGNCPTTSWYT